MSYCPKCRHEYADSVATCLDCGTPLLRSQRPRRSAVSELELEDLLIPVGALVCGVIAIAMLWLRIAAQFGWIKGTFAQLIQTSQPPCMTVFYAVAAIASILVLAWWAIQVFIFKKG